MKIVHRYFLRTFRLALLGAAALVAAGLAPEDGGVINGSVGCLRPISGLPERK